jgi:hypothetical protein
MFVARGLPGLLGIGSGAAKVLAMDQVMRIPFKMATTTSNFMIGVTAAASAGIYLNRGFIDPGLAMSVMFAVLLGSVLGVHVLMRAQTRTLRRTGIDPAWAPPSHRHSGGAGRVLDRHLRPAAGPQVRGYHADRPWRPRLQPRGGRV